MISGTALTCYQDDQEYLAGPWRLWTRKDVEAADTSTDGLGQPLDERGDPLLYQPSDLFQRSSADWAIILGPYGQRGPFPAHPDGDSVTMFPAARRREGDATLNFIGQVPGAYDTDFLLYTGEGEVPAWRGDPVEMAPIEEPPISGDVLEHIDAVVDAVREIQQKECSPLEAMFLDALVDQLEILREHVEASEPTPRPHSVLRYLGFVRQRLAGVAKEMPTIAARVANITRAITEILQIAG